MTAELNSKSARMKELGELIRFAGEFKRLTPIYEEWNSIRFKKARDKYRAEHEREINLFLLAKRKLDAAAPDHKLPVKAWQKELDKLTAAYTAESEQLKPIRDELKELYRIKSKLERKKKPINNSYLPDHEIEAIARCILPDIVALFESEEGQKEFAEWKAAAEGRRRNMKSNKMKKPLHLPCSLC